jgi:anti-anti-sigma factor
MDINVSRSGSVASLSMKGKFDIQARTSFKNAYTPLLDDQGITTLDIILAEVDHMDSSALGMLLLLLDRAQAVGKEVILSKANSTVTKIFDIASFEKLFTIR